MANHPMKAGELAILLHIKKKKKKNKRFGNFSFTLILQCHGLVVDLPVPAQRLDLMIVKVFSSRADSVTLKSYFDTSSFLLTFYFLNFWQGF